MINGRSMDREQGQAAAVLRGSQPAAEGCQGADVLLIMTGSDHGRSMINGRSMDRERGQAAAVLRGS